MVIIWCYLADQDDPVFPPQETLNKMNISNELKQVLQATLNPDPSKRPTLQNLLNLLSKIPGYDQSFKLNDLKDTKKAHTSVVSVEITVEEAKLKPIHAKLIYHICSLLHKLSATDVFENPNDDFYNKIYFLLENSILMLQSSKDESQIQYTTDIKKYCSNLQKYFLTDPKKTQPYKCSQPNELIEFLEQNFVKYIRQYIENPKPLDPATSPDNPMIRNCKRLLILCYLIKIIGTGQITKEEECIIAYKLSRLNQTPSLQKEYDSYSKNPQKDHGQPVESQLEPNK